LSRQCRDNLFPIGTSLLAQDFPLDTLADAPVKEHQAGVHGLSDARAAGIDERAQLNEELRGVRLLW
jgi:hypothetical protein